VWLRSGGEALVATVDFFTPIVDDARTWGAIAAANASSDVYAMGGSPTFALNVVSWPSEQLPTDLLVEVLEGARQKASEGGWLVVGGHTIDGPEPVFGQAVVGEVARDWLLTNAGARPGDALLLTKALGTGALSTAVKRSAPEAILPGGWLEKAYRAAVDSMLSLNDEAARVARSVDASAATDVTGFGLLGHLHGMLNASGVSARIEESQLPLLEGAAELVYAGYVPGGTRRNLSHLRSSVNFEGQVNEDLLADPQTSGGLLMSCAPARAGEALRRLEDSGHAAAVIGMVTDGHAGSITVRAA
jgi:selenide,water dikinase